MNTVYNATGNSFHADGAPTEIDISLSFMEDKTLTRNDLYSDDGGIPNYDKFDYDWDKIGVKGKTAEAAGNEVAEEYPEGGTGMGDN